MDFIRKSTHFNPNDSIVESRKQDSQLTFAEVVETRESRASGFDKASASFHGQTMNNDIIVDDDYKNISNIIGRSVGPTP